MVEGDLREGLYALAVAIGGAITHAEMRLLAFFHSSPWQTERENKKWVVSM